MQTKTNNSKMIKQTNQMKTNNLQIKFLKKIKKSLKKIKKLKSQLLKMLLFLKRPDHLKNLNNALRSRPSEKNNLITPKKQENLRETQEVLPFIKNLKKRKKVTLKESLTQKIKKNMSEKN